ncbi:MAG: peptide deformylase [Candidatus Aminicenantales bacterium]
MAILEIIKYGHPTLSKKAEAIKNIDEQISKLAQNMLQTMRAAPGIGLAAPQVNKSLRLITVDLSLGENEKDVFVLINPEIVNKEGQLIEVEGCLSVPEIQEKVLRPSQIIIKGINLQGKEQVIEAKDLLARVFCHEIDHLNGKLFIDYLSPLKRSLIRKKLKKIMEKKRIP